MTWPVSNKATTTDIDQGTDSPNLSRVQIKKDIDNVNSITDTFDIGTPPNGSILTFNSTAGKFNTTANQSLAKAFVFYKGFETTLSSSASNGVYPTTTDGRRNNMMDRGDKFDPFGFITDITGDGFELAQGTYSIITQSDQARFLTNFGAFGSENGQSFLDHRLENIENDGDSNNNYPARWSSTFLSGVNNEVEDSRGNHHYSFTVSSGQTKKFYLFAFPQSPGGNFSTGEPSLANPQNADVLLEITKTGG